MTITTYPSVISQPGSAARNMQPVIEALQPLIEGNGTPARRILELASYPYEHIRGYAKTWPQVHFAGTARDSEEIERIATDDLPENIAKPAQLDVAIQDDWDALKANTTEAYDGVVMLNLVHCCPEGVPEHVFRNLSPRTAEGRRVLVPNAWLAVYGAYLNDDGTFRSEGDAKFDAEYIKGVHPSLGLRTPKSIVDMAERWGWRQESRTTMPKGNLWFVFRAEVPGEGGNGNSNGNSNGNGNGHVIDV